MRIRSTIELTSTVTQVQHGTCSCVIVNGEQFILTAKHVVSDPRGPRYTVEVGNEWIPCELVAHSKTDDLALLKPSRHIAEAFKLAPSEAVLAIGSTLGQPVTETKAPITSFLIDVPMEHGMSGGPVFDETSHIAGVMIAITTENGKRRGLVLSAATIRKFLNSITKPEVAVKKD